MLVLDVNSTHITKMNNISVTREEISCNRKFSDKEPKAVPMHTAAPTAKLIIAVAGNVNFELLDFFIVYLSSLLGICCGNPRPFNDRVVETVCLLAGAYLEPTFLKITTIVFKII